MSFDEALKMASREERFMATVYAMNTLLIQKGIYAAEEFESFFIEWVSKEQSKAWALTSSVMQDAPVR
jgi:uncharacterized membrane protein YoaT (DUF817 family)